MSDGNRTILRPPFSRAPMEWHRAIAASADVELLEIRDAAPEENLPLIRWRQGGHSFMAAPRWERGIERMRIWRAANNCLGNKVTDSVVFGYATPPAVVWKELTRIARILAIAGLAAMVTACAGTAAPAADAGDATPVADAGLDARPALDAGAPDAAGLGLEADCDPTLDQCAGGLTCRPDGKLRGHCRPVGQLPAGAACGAEAECGYAMTWFSDDLGVARCAVICNTEAPQPRCKPNQPCLPLVGRLGVCQP